MKAAARPLVQLHLRAGAGTRGRQPAAKSSWAGGASASGCAQVRARPERRVQRGGGGWVALGLVPRRQQQLRKAAAEAREGGSTGRRCGSCGAELCSPPPRAGSLCCQRGRGRPPALSPGSHWPVRPPCETASAPTRAWHRGRTHPLHTRWPGVTNPLAPPPPPQGHSACKVCRTLWGLATTPDRHRAGRCSCVPGEATPHPRVSRKPLPQGLRVGLLLSSFSLWRGVGCCALLGPHCS